jgi:hypothetical protein
MSIAGQLMRTLEATHWLVSPTMSGFDESQAALQIVDPAIQPGHSVVFDFKTHVLVLSDSM